MFILNTFLDLTQIAEIFHEICDNCGGNVFSKLQVVFACVGAANEEQCVYSLHRSVQGVLWPVEVATIFRGSFHNFAFSRSYFLANKRGSSCADL